MFPFEEFYKIFRVTWAFALVLSVVRMLLVLCLLGLGIWLLVLGTKALRRYLRGSEQRKEKSATRKTLGQILKEHRVRCKMTQEFVAERLGVSRQAVSKWESGASDPSTSNLLALARLFEVSPEELLRGWSEPKRGKRNEKDGKDFGGGADPRHGTVCLHGGAGAGGLCGRGLHHGKRRGQDPDR